MKSKYEFNPVVIPMIMLFAVLFTLLILVRCHS